MSHGARARPHGASRSASPSRASPRRGAGTARPTGAAPEAVVAAGRSAFYEKTGALGRLVANKWNVDEGIEALVLSPFRKIGTFLWRGFDALFIDGIANASAFLVELTGDLLRFFTTGQRPQLRARASRSGSLVLVVYVVGEVAPMSFAPPPARRRPPDDARLPARRSARSSSLFFPSDVEGRARRRSASSTSLAHVRRQRPHRPPLRPGDRRAPTAFAIDRPWIPRFGIRYQLGVDGLSLALVLLTTLLTVSRPPRLVRAEDRRGSRATSPRSSSSRRGCSEASSPSTRSSSTSSGK